MALKLQGIEPRPLDQRRSRCSAPSRCQAAVQVEALPTGNDDLIRIWRPQACLKAQKGESEFVIARFLHSKGVEGSAARAAAREIIANPASSPGSKIDFKRPLGWAFLGLGLAVPVACFISGFPNIMTLLFSLMAAALGGWLLWNPPKID